MCEHGRQEGNCPAPPREQHRHPEQQSADTATHRFTGSEPCHGSREVLWQELSIAVVRQQHGCWPLLMPHHPDLPLSCSCAQPPPAPLRLLPIRVWHSHDFPRLPACRAWPVHSVIPLLTKAGTGELESRADDEFGSGSITFI